MCSWIPPVLILLCTAASIAAQEKGDAQQPSPTKRQPSTKPDSAELALLRDEVRALRGDIARLIELLEAQANKPHDPPAIASQQTKKTSAQRVSAAGANEFLYAMTYHVADVVVPIHKMVTLNVDSKSAANSAMKAPEVDFQSLIAIITSRIEPATWEANGGAGSIQVHPRTLSIVICQTQSIHGQVSRLLATLRRAESRQVALGAAVITIDERKAASILPAQSSEPQLLTASQTSALRDLAQNDRSANIYQPPKVTLFSDQSVRMHLALSPVGSLNLLLYPALSKNLQSMRLRAAVNPQDESDLLRSSDSIVVPAGASLLVDLPDDLDLPQSASELARRLALADFHTQVKPQSDRGTVRRLLLVTPQIIEEIEEEEEQLLGAPSTP